MTLVRRNLPAATCPPSRTPRRGPPALSLTWTWTPSPGSSRRLPRLALRTGERDGLLIALHFHACLRVSEGINLRPRDLSRTNAGGLGGHGLTGKGNKTAQGAVNSFHRHRLFQPEYAVSRQTFSGYLKVQSQGERTHNANREPGLPPDRKKTPEASFAAG